MHRSQIGSPKDFQNSKRLNHARTTAEFLARRNPEELTNIIFQAIKQSSSEKAEEFQTINKEIESATEAFMQGKPIDQKLIAEQISKLMAIVNSVPRAHNLMAQYLSDSFSQLGMTRNQIKPLVKSLESPIPAPAIAHGLNIAKQLAMAA